MENRIKTVIFLALLTGLLLWIGNFFGTNGLVIASVFVVLMNVGSYYFSHKIVLMMYSAKEANEKEYPELYKSVREVANLANIPMPKVYIIKSPSPNAFATGRNPKHGIVAFTEGIIALLNKDELKGVIAHEMSHIKNRDILIATIAGTIAGIIGFLASMARWAAIFGGFGGRDDDSGGIIGLIVMAIVAPIVAIIIQMAVSRSREYLADETAAKTLHSSHGLASALEKLEGGINKVPLDANSGTAHMFISSPFKGKSIMSWFSTHPNTADRVKKLRDLGY